MTVLNNKLNNLRQTIRRDKMFNLFSLELMFIVMVILIYTRLRRTTIYSLLMVKDLKVYFPPLESDFDCLMESLTPAKQRENSKGKKNKFDARKSKNLQAKIPLRVEPMGTDLLQKCNVFFQDFDFLLMLFHYCVLMTFVIIVMKLFVPLEFTQTNLTFYMATITLALILANLRKNAFPAGCTKLTDETKV